MRKERCGKGGKGGWSGWLAAAAAAADAQPLIAQTDRNHTMFFLARIRQAVGSLFEPHMAERGKAFHAVA